MPQGEKRESTACAWARMLPFLLVVHTSRRRLKGHGNRLPTASPSAAGARRGAPHCQAAGVPTRFLHDCRRTAARTLIRASVPERVAMLLTGHKTRAIFGRYNIIHEQELLEAGDQLVAYLAQHAQATPRGLNPGFSEKIGNSRRTAPTAPGPPAGRLAVCGRSASGASRWHRP